MLPMDNVTYAKCTIYESEPMQNVTVQKCTVHYVTDPYAITYTGPKTPEK